MMTAEIVAWLIGGGGLVSVGTLVWWNGRFNGKVSTELKALTKELNGPTKAKFDSQAKRSLEALGKIDALREEIVKRWPMCAVHDEAIKRIEKSIDRVYRRQERIQSVQGEEK